MALLAGSVVQRWDSGLVRWGGFVLIEVRIRNRGE